MAMGHNPNTLTSANCVILYRCKGVYDNWIKLEGFQVGTASTFGDVTVGETRMGVDGKQSGGFVPHETPFSVNLEANSPSMMILENTYNDFIANMETRLCEFQITMPSVKRRQSLSGYMTIKSGGTGISSLLDGSVYNFSQVSQGVEEI